MARRDIDPVQAMLEIRDTLISCQEGRGGVASAEVIDLAGDVLSWLFYSQIERRSDSDKTVGRSSDDGRTVVGRSSDTRSLNSEISFPKSEILEKPSQESASARAKAAPSDDGRTVVGRRSDVAPSDDGSSDDADRDLYRAMVRAWDPFGGVTLSGTYQSRIRAMVPVLRDIGAARGEEPAALWSAAVERFKADPGVKLKRLGLATFCNQLQQWLDPSPTPAVTNGRVAPPSSLEAFEQQLAEERARGAA